MKSAVMPKRRSSFSRTPVQAYRSSPFSLSSTRAGSPKAQPLIKAHHHTYGSQFPLGNQRLEMKVQVIRLPPGDGLDPKPNGMAHHPPLSVTRVDMSVTLFRVRHLKTFRPAHISELSVPIQAHHEVHKRPAEATHSCPPSGQSRPQFFLKDQSLAHRQNKPYRHKTFQASQPTAGTSHSCAPSSNSHKPPAA